MLLVLNYPVYEVKEVARKYVNCTELMRWADWTEAGAVAAASSCLVLLTNYCDLLVNADI
jgi:hypothetical protein